MIGLRRKVINELTTDLGDTYFEENSYIRTSFLGYSVNLIYFELTAAPSIPDGLGNRTRENWFPLLKIVVLAGWDWIEKANTAI